MAVPVSIRRIEADDWAALRDVRLRSLLDSPDAFGQRYEDALAMPDDELRQIARSAAAGDRRAWYLARAADGAVVGVVQARRRPPADCMLFSMWVGPEARSSGVGAALVDAVDAWGRSWDAERVVLWVIATNEGAMRFYERIGFTLVIEGPDAESGHAYGAIAMERPTSRGSAARPRSDPVKPSADPSRAG